MVFAAHKLEISPERNLSRYLQRIRTYPMLEVNEEFQLAARWRDNEDSDAAHRLAGVLREIGLGVEGIDLRHAPVQIDVNHVLSATRMMWCGCCRGEFDSSIASGRRHDSNLGRSHKRGRGRL